MNRVLQFAAALLLPAGLLCADQPTSKPVKPQTVIPKGGGTPGVPGKNKGERVVNPANPVIMLFKASPAERDRALERANPQVQQNARKLLAWFDSLPAADKAFQLRRADLFSKLSVEEKAVIRDEVVALNDLPMDQFHRVRTVLINLQKLPEEQRHQRMNNERWASQFNAEQLRIIRNLADWF